MLKVKVKFEILFEKHGCCLLQTEEERGHLLSLSVLRFKVCISDGKGTVCKSLHLVVSNILDSCPSKFEIGGH